MHTNLDNIVEKHLKMYYIKQHGDIVKVTKSEQPDKSVALKITFGDGTYVILLKGVCGVWWRQTPSTAYAKATFL